MLAGILTPSEGEVTVDGHISSLLTLGVGFDQDLSGVDNIRLAGAFMGMPHRDVEERLEAIVEYAELGQFIDAPIKTYSSGMRARLGFAIATSVDPDILLLDEVLATGDAAFREKSKQRVLELVGGAKAIVLVTHDMNWVQEYCTRAMLIEQGRIVADGLTCRGRPGPSRAHGPPPRAGQGEGRLREEARLTRRPGRRAARRQRRRMGPMPRRRTSRSPVRTAIPIAAPRPITAPAASAPRHSRIGRTSPWTCWAMRIPIADGRLIVTRCAITFRATRLLERSPRAR